MSSPSLTATPFMDRDLSYIIMYDHHVWSSYMMIIYDDHICSSCMIIIYKDHIRDHIRWSYTMIIHDDHIWWSYMIIIYDDHIWSSYTKDPGPWMGSPWEMVSSYFGEWKLWSRSCILTYEIILKPRFLKEIAYIYQCPYISLYIPIHPCLGSAAGVIWFNTLKCKI